jgi:hypothetical protein
MWMPETPSAIEPRPPGPWIRSRRWDLTFILGSGLLVAVPLLSYYGIARLTGTPPEAFQERPALGIAMLMNLAIAFLIGGPHVYATYTLTLAERRFRRQHPLLLWGAIAVPVIVVTLASVRIELLVAAFFGWASVHVIHQLAYLVQQYQRRAGPTPLPAWSRAIDYALALSCLYPVALWRLLAPEGARLRLPGGLEIQPGFHIGAVDVSQQLPAVLAGQVWIAAAVAGLFGVAALAFLARTAWELATGRMLWPRTLLLLTTAPVAFALPLFHNLDVALQGFNLWHSAQYLGLVYLMNAYRKQREAISSPFVASLSGLGNGQRYYAFVVAVSVGVGGLIGVLHYGAGLPLLQVYYAVHLSGLLVHYLWDHAVFLQPDALTPLAPAAR